MIKNSNLTENISPEDDMCPDDWAIFSEETRQLEYDEAEVYCSTSSRCSQHSTVNSNHSLNVDTRLHSNPSIIAHEQLLFEGSII